MNTPSKVQRYAAHMVECFGRDKCLAMNAVTFTRYLTMLDWEDTNRINAGRLAGWDEFRDAGRIAGQVRAIIAGTDWPTNNGGVK